MTTIRLPRNVQFLYEEHLARLEFAALGCTDLQRQGDEWGQLTAHVNGSGPALLERSAYAGTVDGAPSVYSQLIQPGYQGGRFNRTRSVNQYLTHWIYPYRGKFHPQMVRALFNLLGAGPGSRVLEPFVGSGTAALEASLLGCAVVAVDLSPLCVLLTRVKTAAWQHVDAIRSAVDDLLSGPVTLARLKAAAGSASPVSDFLRVVLMVTTSDTERRGRLEGKALHKNVVEMLASIEAHATAVREFGLTPGPVTVEVGDARRLIGIPDSSIDACVTSPPYSIALDYVKNDEHALDELGIDLEDLRTRMTGVRGRGAQEKLHLYNEDLKQVFREVARVLVGGGQAAFVVGDATVDRSEVTTTHDMSAWADDAGLRLVRSIPKIVFGLYSVMTDEKILIFRKP